MDKLVIEGGARLAGEVEVSGAKNSALPVLCAAILSAEPLTVTNVPRLQDVATTAKLLSTMGSHGRAARRAHDGARLREARPARGTL